MVYNFKILVNLQMSVWDTMRHLISIGNTDQDVSLPSGKWIPFLSFFFFFFHGEFHPVQGPGTLRDTIYEDTCGR